MKELVRGVLHPEAFHGKRARAPFFEGWYLKLVTGDARRSLVIIPGLFRGTEQGSAHAFIQVMSPTQPSTRYEAFASHLFKGADDSFDVEICGHRFHAGGLSLSLPGCRGEVTFGPLSPWPTTPLSPGVMGWYAWVPFMQCYHGVLSLDHVLHGQMEVDGELMDFDGGRGYIEKDWGRSFPKRWLWMQSNHFGEEGVSVFISAADIPWLGGAFAGFLVGFWRGGQLLRFTTYTGAKLDRIEAHDEGATIEVSDARHQLSVTARGGHPQAVHAPSETSMRGVVHEHLDASLEVLLVRRDPATGRQEVLFEGVGGQAAYEVQGRIDRLRRRLPFAKDGP